MIEDKYTLIFSLNFIIFNNGSGKVVIEELRWMSIEIEIIIILIMEALFKNTLKIKAKIIYQWFPY